MTWRNFAYWLIVVLPVLIVAAATGSEPDATGEAPTLASAWTQVHMTHLSDPLRSASLVAGVIAVAFTFLRVWQNLRHRA